MNDHQLTSAVAVIGLPADPSMTPVLPLGCVAVALAGAGLVLLVWSIGVTIQRGHTIKAKDAEIDRLRQRIRLLESEPCPREPALVDRAAGDEHITTRATTGR